VGVYVTFPVPAAPVGAQGEGFHEQLQELQALADAFSPGANSLVAPGTLRAWYPAYLGWLEDSLAPGSHSLQSQTLQDPLGSPALLCTG